jgi:hypothetical protein
MPFWSGRAGLRKLYHRGSLHRLHIALLMAPVRSSGNSLVIIVSLDVSYGLWDSN